MAAAVADFAPRARRAGEDPARGNRRALVAARADRGRPRRARKRGARADQTLVGIRGRARRRMRSHRAREKLERKGIDAIVFNDVSRAEIGFDSEDERGR